MGDGAKRTRTAGENASVMLPHDTGQSGAPDHPRSPDIGHREADSPRGLQHDQYSQLIIINDLGIFMNMRLIRPADLARYQPALERWMPKARIRPAAKQLRAFDGVVAWKTPVGTIRYLVEEKRHLRYQDAGVLADQLRRRLETLPREHADDRLLLLAPHVRPQQAEILERHEIDYLDLAGNAHLQAPGLFVHVEGRQPLKEAARLVPVRPQKGWIKAVMAMLVRPELVNAPYRTLAAQADVAFGTVVGCMNDLAVRGLVTGNKTGRRVADRQALLALWVQVYIEALRPKLAERRFQVKAGDKAVLRTRLRIVLAERGHAGR